MLINMQKITSKAIYLLLTLCMLFYLTACNGDSDETNLPPLISNQSFNVSENSIVGSSVGILVASDPENEALSFSIATGNTDDAFEVGDTSGELIIAGNLDHENIPSYTLVVEVSDGINVSSANIEILVIDEAENSPPSIENQAFTVEENSSNGFVVGSISAQDLDEDELSFSIISGNTDDVFVLETSSGELKVDNSEFLDFETNPTFELIVQVSDGDLTTQAEVTINLTDIEPEQFTTEQQVKEALASGYEEWKAYIEFTYLFDATYANTINSPDSEWDDVFDHNITSANAKVEQLWNDGRSLIFHMNNVIISAEALFPNGQERDEIVGQATLIRSHVYFVMTSWFENIPIETEISDSGSNMSTKSELITLIKSDLNLASSLLPADWTGEESGNVGSNVADALLARVLNENGEPMGALTESEELIVNSGLSLESDGALFNENHSEFIWSFAKTGEATFDNAFNKGAYVPLIRLTELYLINAASNLTSSDNASAINRINELLTRNGDASLTLSSSFSDIQESLINLWVSEMGFEGNVFFVLRQFERAETDLILQSFELILPIPQSAIDENVNLFQNPGY